MSHPLIVDNKFHTRTVEEQFSTWSPKLRPERYAAAWILDSFLGWGDYNLPVAFNNMPGRSRSDQFTLNGETFELTYQAKGAGTFQIGAQVYRLLKHVRSPHGYTDLTYEVDGERMQATVSQRPAAGACEKEIFVTLQGGIGVSLGVVNRLPLSGGAANEGDYRAPMPGKVSRILVKKGERVEKGQRLLTLEAMKMENEINAFQAGMVEDIFVSANDQVEMGRTLLHLKGE